MRPALLPGLAPLLLVLSCSPEIPRVGGEFGESPTIEEISDAPEEAASEVVIAGDGPQIDTGSLIALRVLTHPVSDAGELGAPLVSSFDQDSESLLTHSEFIELFPGDSVPGELRVGSRVVNVLPADETTDSALISVIDIVGTYPSDAEVSGKLDQDLALDNGIDLSDPRNPVPQEETQPPKRTRALPLIEGEGPVVPDQGQVVVQFRGFTWSDGTVFDTTWQSGQPPVPLPLGQGSLVDAWDFELPGHTVGSRLLLLVPPEEGYGAEGNPDVGISPNEPLIYMIDVLGVH